MKPPLVSILMPVRNGGTYLVECLDSILDQTLTDWELIAVDDHSNDQSFEVIEALSKKDNRVKVLHNERTGIAAALERAFDIATGSFVTRMDCDDLMAPEKLRKLVEAVDENPGHIAISLVKYFPESLIGDGYRRYTSWLNDLTENGENYSGIYRECVIPSPAWMMRREDADRLGLMKSLDHPEDYEFCFRCLQANVPIVPVKEILHLWRDHDNRTSRTDPAYDIRRFGPFKLRWLLSLEQNENTTIYLWGCGKKGKELASFLLFKEHAFTWLSGNQDRIDQEIYGEKIASPKDQTFDKNSRIILALSAPADQSEVVEELEKQGLREGIEFFLFY